LYYVPRALLGIMLCEWIEDNSFLSAWMANFISELGEPNQSPIKWGCNPGFLEGEPHYQLSGRT